MLDVVGTIDDEDDEEAKEVEDGFLLAPLRAEDKVVPQSSPFSASHARCSANLSSNILQVLGPKFSKIAHA